MLSIAWRKPLLLALGTVVTAGFPPAAGVMSVAKTVLRVAPVVKPVFKRRTQELPAVDIPTDWRRQNWAPYGEGSCVHASLVMLFHWQARHDLGDWWEANYHSGEYPERLAQRLEAAGVTFAETRDGDVKFLEWALRTRRGAAVTVQGGRHMVLMVHLDAERAGILDNNAPHTIQWRPRADFLREWQASGHRWGVTPVYAPPPVSPWI
jgi:hypothetical protein